MHKTQGYKANRTYFKKYDLVLELQKCAKYIRTFLYSMEIRELYSRDDDRI